MIIKRKKNARKEKSEIKKVFFCLFLFLSVTAT